MSHQQKGVDFLHAILNSLDYQGALLADEMGLGKTSEFSEVS